MKKGSKKFAAILAAAVLLMGCQNDTEPKPDITSGGEENTKFEISQSVTDIPIGEDEVTENVTESSEETDFIPKLLMDTDKSFVRAEDLYIIEKRDIDVSVFNEHDLPDFAAEGKYFYCEPLLEENSETGVTTAKESYIYVYDTETGEYSKIYSEECSKDTNILYFTFAALKENYLYYFREEGRFNAQSSTSEGFDLCRLNLDTNRSEHIFSLNNETFWNVKDQVDVIGNSMYFYDVHDIDYEYMEFIRAVYSFDFDTGEVTLFRDDADYVMPYKNGLIYYHDGGYYYHGEDKDIRGKGVYYEGDELLFYFDQDQDPYQITAVVAAKGDTIGYGMIDHDTGECTVGIFDENYEQQELASPQKGTFYMYMSGVNETGLVYLHATSPLVYDTQSDSFALIPIDGTDHTNYWNMDSTEDSIRFFVYEYEDDEYTSATVYSVKRR